MRFTRAHYYKLMGIFLKFCKLEKELTRYTDTNIIISKGYHFLKYTSVNRPNSGMKWMIILITTLN